MVALVTKAQHGDTTAFVALMEAYKGDLYRVAKGYFRSDEDVADAIGETVLACYEHIGSLRQPEYFKTWLTKILIGKCRDLLRAGRRYVSEESLPDQGLMDSNQANVEFMALLDVLDEKYRTVLLLYYGEGFSTREIAALLHISTEAVKSRLRRGRAQAQKAYES